MNPHALFMLFRLKRRRDVRAPVRREDEEPLHFVISNATYRLVLLAERLWEQSEPWRGSWAAERD